MKILHWDLTIRCGTQKQANAIVTELLCQEIFYDFSYSYKMLEQGYEYIITIHDMPWGNNLEILAKIVNRHDSDLDKNIDLPLTADPKFIEKNAVALREYYAKNETQKEPIRDLRGSFFAEDLENIN